MKTGCHGVKTGGQVEGGPGRIPEQGEAGVAAASASVVGRPRPMNGVGGTQPVGRVSDARAGRAGGRWGSLGPLGTALALARLWLSLAVACLPLNTSTLFLFQPN